MATIASIEPRKRGWLCVQETREEEENKKEAMVGLEQCTVLNVEFIFL
jgi:hypothetical protein